MAAERIAPPRAQDPPDALVNRTATVAPRVMNTIRVPTDRFEDAKAAWFLSGGKMPDVIEGNRVKFMIDAAASKFRSTCTNAFHEMVMAIRTATRPGHFLYIASWFCDVSFEIESGVTLAKLVREASRNGVMIRAMLWKTPSITTVNQDAVWFFNSVRPTAQGLEPVEAKDKLENAAAIWDDRGNEDMSHSIPFGGLIPRHVGTQHQKILCVYGEQGLLSFCGGIEFNKDRINFPPPYPTGWWHSARPTADGGPLHDLHCRIEGPASFDVANVFIQRWNGSSPAACPGKAKRRQASFDCSA